MIAAGCGGVGGVGKDDGVEDDEGSCNDKEDSGAFASDEVVGVAVEDAVAESVVVPARDNKLDIICVDWVSSRTDLD